LINKHEGKVSVVVKRLGSGDLYERDAQRVMPTASLIKFPVMLATYREATAGRVSLDQQITLAEADKVPGSGILTTHFSAGTTLSLRDAVRLMMVYSDNTATNLVARAIGLTTTADFMNELGFPQTKLHSYVYRRDTSAFPERSELYGLGSTTASDIVQLLERLHDRQWFSADASQEMIEHMGHCDDSTKLRRFLPGVKFVHKTGAVNATRCDAGWFESASGTIAICVLTTDNQDQSWGDGNQAEVLCGRIAEAVHQFYDTPSSTQPDSRPDTAHSPMAIGAQGIVVEALQRTLNARLDPSPQLSTDGDFGPATEAAVIRFQRENKLAADGVVTAETWQVLGPLVDSAEPQVLAPAAPKLAAESLDGPPLVTCNAWCILDAQTGEPLAGHRADVVVEPASTTKLMTALLVARLAEQNPEILTERVVFSKYADATIGSSATIRAGESIEMRELLYGLLLPSGNDAAVAIAEHCGDRCQQLSPSPSQPDDDKLTAYDKFIACMNRTAQVLGLTNTFFENPHGLPGELHRSTAADLAILGRQVSENQLLSEIVNTSQHLATVTGVEGYQRSIVWTNTNRLLQHEGYMGLKTGTTTGAGACLVACGERESSRLIVVVLGASSSDARYTDARNLFRWAWQQNK
jgi:D-alanyl-D-alanine carboxypeptidase (penicillin-binding protein 5/6)